MEDHDKRDFLMDLLDAGNAKCLFRLQFSTYAQFSAPDALTLVFVETKRGTNDLAYYLGRAKYNCVCIHGDLKQFERESNLDLFRKGTATILVATAVSC